MDSMASGQFFLYSPNKFSWDVLIDLYLSEIVVLIRKINLIFFIKNAILCFIKD